MSVLRFFRRLVCLALLEHFFILVCKAKASKKKYSSISTYFLLFRILKLNIFVKIRSFSTFYLNLLESCNTKLW